MNIAVLVLAAGKSSRMKSIKQLEKIDNKTLLDISLDKAKLLETAAVFCVLGANAKQIQQEISTKDVPFIENENYEKGLSASIVAGIHHLKKSAVNYDGVFILLADQPAITISYLKDMISIFQENPTKIIASKYASTFGVPALFPKKYFDALLGIEFDNGAKELINTHKKEVLCSKLETDFTDIDTKEDLKLFKNQY